MFENNENNGGSEYGYGLYGSSGDKVVDAYVAGKIMQGVSNELGLNKVTNEDIIGLMAQRIEQVGPVKVSNHGMNPDQSNVLDLAPSSLKNPRLFFNALRKDSRINQSKLFTPFNSTDRAFHIQIPQQ